MYFIRLWKLNKLTNVKLLILEDWVFSSIKLKCDDDDDGDDNQKGDEGDNGH